MTTEGQIQAQATEPYIAPRAWLKREPHPSAVDVYLHARARWHLNPVNPYPEDSREFEAFEIGLLHEEWVQCSDLD